jgi:hypothetical protein
MNTLRLDENSPPEYYIKSPEDFLSGRQAGGMDIENVNKKLSIAIAVIIITAILLCTLITAGYLSLTQCQVSGQTEFDTNSKQQ